MGSIDTCSFVFVNRGRGLYIFRRLKGSAFTNNSSGIAASGLTWLFVGRVVFCFVTFLVSRRWLQRTYLGGGFSLRTCMHDFFFLCCGGARLSIVSLPGGVCGMEEWFSHTLLVWFLWRPSFVCASVAFFFLLLARL